MLENVPSPKLLQEYVRFPTAAPVREELKFSVLAPQNLAGGETEILEIWEKPSCVPSSKKIPAKKLFTWSNFLFIVNSLFSA